MVAAAKRTARGAAWLCYLPVITMEECMPVFKLPLSGDVVQNISPFTAFMSPIGSQFGLINITLGRSSAPEVESDVLSDVGTYGKQLGQISDALLVLIERMPRNSGLTMSQLSKRSRRWSARLPKSKRNIAVPHCVRDRTLGPERSTRDFLPSNGPLYHPKTADYAALIRPTNPTIPSCGEF
jgi:hypothetical protein